MTTTPEQATQVILDAIRSLVQALRLSSVAVQRQMHLSGAQLFVLQALAERGPLSINDLAAATFTHQSSVSVVAKKLTEKALVLKTADPNDARRSLHSLTPQARKLLAQAPPLAQHRLVAAIQKLTIDDRRRLGALLHELNTEAGFITTLPPLFFEE